MVYGSSQRCRGPGRPRKYDLTRAQTGGPESVKAQAPLQGKLPVNQLSGLRVQGFARLGIRCEDDDRPNFSGDWMMVKVPVPKQSVHEYSMSAIKRWIGIG